MGRTAQAHERLITELNEERAAALRRISQTLEGLISQLHHVRESIVLAKGSERSNMVATYQDLRARAVRYRWYLEVQREAIGLRHHQRLDEFYRIPPDIT